MYKFILTQDLKKDMMLFDGSRIQRVLKRKNDICIWTTQGFILYFLNQKIIIKQ